MKSLTNFINESISKKEILSQAKEVNDLTSWNKQVIVCC